MYGTVNLCIIKKTKLHIVQNGVFSDFDLLWLVGKLSQSQAPQFTCLAELLLAYCPA